MSKATLSRIAPPEAAPERVWAILDWSITEQNDPKILALGTRVLQADINSDVAKAAGISPPYPGFSGIVAQALRPWPQYQGINWHSWPIGKSIYHSVQVKLDKRFSNGVLFRVFYTRSKLLNNAADNGYNNSSANGLQNPVDARPEWFGEA